MCRLQGQTIAHPTISNSVRSVRDGSAANFFRAASVSDNAQLNFPGLLHAANLWRSNFNITLEAMDARASSDVG
jgi:hypothetical protein